MRVRLLSLTGEGRKGRAFGGGSKGLSTVAVLSGGKERKDCE